MAPMMISGEAGCVHFGGKRRAGGNMMLARSFARVSRFADNLNHAPMGYDGARTSDDVMDFLRKIAAGR